MRAKPYQCGACGALIDSDERCPECGAGEDEIFDAEAEGEEEADGEVDDDHP
jgi:hypothetical protein